MAWIYPQGLLVFGLLAVVGLLLMPLSLMAAIVRRLRRLGPLSWRWPAAGLLAMVAGVLGVRTLIRAQGVTGGYAAIDARMALAYRSSPLQTDEIPPGFLLLRGDLHCHIAPPDEAYHVSRGLDATLALARSERLDFVVLVPHIWTPSMPITAYRELLLDGHRTLARELATRDLGGLLVSPGAEATDDSWGHAGMAFGDFDQALRPVTDDEETQDLGAFFDRYRASGGMLTIHHPFEQPRGLPARFFAVDMSWRPFTYPQLVAPAHIQQINRSAKGIEAYNLGVSEMKDWSTTGDRESSLRQVLARIDTEILAQRRRITATGGTDSHGFFLRPVLFVLARERSIASVKEAIEQGRTCVRDEAACSFVARRPGGNWAPAGASLPGTDQVEIKVPAADATVLRNGHLVATVPRGESRLIPVPPGECSLVRVQARGGYSSPVYVNCDF